MDSQPPQQSAARTDFLKDDITKHLLTLKWTARCFETLRDDLHAAINELSQYDMRLYLKVAQECDQLKCDMETVRQNSEEFTRREATRPDLIRKHISESMKHVRELRQLRQEITTYYMAQMIGEEKKWSSLELSLDIHMSQLGGIMRRIVHATETKFQTEQDLAVEQSQAAKPTSGPSGLAPQKD
ncbi:hypothetical protein J7T55_014682 [Diaporthe amygdali]|uniref:uncharacterized protein n=1 Tax=Phomopsis amygdali TaxID=1214568 RepID=UPI0022FE3457|nr:uncharacterized protein J7T55_014682 [Diaporthe amygdali]KAJ0107152.1 hypothetical protein J7T55_014682 [Diaporthe amygdali]